MQLLFLCKFVVIEILKKGEHTVQTLFYMPKVNNHNNNYLCATFYFFFQVLLVQYAKYIQSLSLRNILSHAVVIRVVEVNWIHMMMLNHSKS